MTRIFMVLLAVLVAMPAAAQPPRGPQQGRGPQVNRGVQPPRDDMSPAQLHQLFDAMLVMQAQKALSLNDQQYAQFLTRVQRLQEARRRHQTERVRLINELQRMTNPRNPQPPAEAEVKERLSALHELESRTAADLRRAYDGVDEVLNPLQQARFRVLEEQIERRKLELVGRARQNNPKRPNQNRR
jgi:hypothetical protein